MAISNIPCSERPEHKLNETTFVGENACRFTEKVFALS